MRPTKTLLAQMTNLSITLGSSILIPVAISRAIGAGEMKNWILASSLAALGGIFNINSSQLFSHAIMKNPRSQLKLNFWHWLLHAIYSVITGLLTLVAIYLIVIFLNFEQTTQLMYLILVLILASAINYCYEPFSGASIANHYFSSFIWRQIIFRSIDILLLLSVVLEFRNLNLLPYYLISKALLFRIVFKKDFQYLFRKQSIRESVREARDFDYKSMVFANYRVSLTNWFRFQFLNVAFANLLQPASYGAVSIFRTMTSGLRQITEVSLAAFSESLLFTDASNHKRDARLHSFLKYLNLAIAIVGLILISFLSKFLPALLQIDYRIVNGVVFLLLSLSFFEIINGFSINYSVLTNHHELISKIRIIFVLAGATISVAFGIMYGLHAFLGAQISTELAFYIWIWRSSDGKSRTK